MSAATETLPAPIIDHVPTPVEQTVAVADIPVTVSDEPTTVGPLKEESAASGEETETNVTTPSSPKPKRSPFGDLKNKLFTSKSKDTVATVASTEAVKESAVDVPATEQVSTKENEPIVAARLSPAAAETVEEPTKEEKIVKEKKPKSPGVFDKMKGFFGEKKEQKTPKFEKVEESGVVAKDEDVAVTESNQVVAPVETKPEPVVEQVAAPVPHVIEPVSAPLNERVPAATFSEQVKDGQNEVVTPSSPVEASSAENSAAVEHPSVQFDAETKDEKPKKKDANKLGRRLSARLVGLISPKKEKTHKEAELGATTTTADDVAPKVETKIDESPVVAVEPVADKTESEPRVEHSAVTEETKVEQPAKVESETVVEEAKVLEEATPVLAAA